VRFPAVVVGDHAEGGEGDFSFTGKLGFGGIRHADEVEAELAVGVRLSAGGEGGAVHVDVGALFMNGESGGRGAVDEDLAEAFAIGVGGGDVGDDAVAKEGVVLTAAGAVVELVRDEDVARGVVFFEAANGGDANDVADAKRTESPDVGAVVNLGGEELVTTGMTGEKNDFSSRELTFHEAIGGGSEGGFKGELF